MEKPLRILFLLHMHQPLYRLMKNGKSTYSLPWVFMHGIREYYDVARALEESDVRVTINFVPSLLVQLEDYAEGRAEDEFLRLILKDASELEEGEKVFILKNFFAAHLERQISLSNRYRMLFEKRGTPYDLEKKIGRFTTQEWRDLQVHFLLSYMSVYKRREDPDVSELIEKDGSFTEEEKRFLLEKAFSLIESVIPMYRKLMNSGKIEISTSPFYHPILPLILNIETVRDVHPLLDLPKRRFKDPDGVRLQIEEALRHIEKIFGKRPRGIWPPEGALSAEVLLMLEDMGVEWTVTDETLLERSLGLPLREGKKASPLLYRVYQFGGMKVFFRDRILSDKIGFVYGRWNSDRAVEDLMSNILAIKDEGGEVLVLAFDGENPWVSYEDGGIPFLTKLFKRLSLCERAKTFTFSDVKDTEAVKLDRFFPGSWLAGSFLAWIGHPEKNKAWEYLADVKSDLSEILMENNEVREEFMVAEGSDWFWWYGEDHPTIYSEEFDMLFREHLKECYKKAGMPPPPFLDVPIAKMRKEALKRPLVGTISPELDGRVTDYFEWLPAGEIDLRASSSGVMEKSGSMLTRLFFGVDNVNLYIRVDGEINMKSLFKDEGYKLRINFYRPPSTVWSLETGFKKGTFVRFVKREGLREVEEIEGARVAIDRILELCIPLHAFDDAEEIEISMELLREDLVLERYPFSGYFVLSPLKIDQSLYWMV